MDSDAEHLWDGYAEEFDNEPDHGLRDPRVRAAWRSLLVPLMPEHPSRVVDLGCGTGSLSVLLAELGHLVTGLDVSSRMLDLARAKAEITGVELDLIQGDAAYPPFAPGSFDVVVCRHVLWSFHDREAVMARWVQLLTARGRLVLIEGRWATGAGVSAADCRALVLRHRESAHLQKLSDYSQLWGKSVTDERYLIFSAS
jgi:SAM-dependent methyltransferase